MKRICVILLLVLSFVMCASSVWSAPLELKWELSEEQQEKIGVIGKGRVHTIPEGWHFEMKSKNCSIRQGFRLPAKAMYLSQFETEAEILSLEGRAITGIYMGSGTSALLFQISDTDTQLRFAHAGSTSFVSSGKLPQKLVPPAKIKMTYDVETGEIAGFINGEPAVSGNTKKMPNLPNIASINDTGVFVGTMWDSSWAKGVFKSINFVGK